MSHQLQFVDGTKDSFPAINQTSFPAPGSKTHIACIHIYTYVSMHTEYNMIILSSEVDLQKLGNCLGPRTTPLYTQSTLMIKFMFYSLSINYMI